MNLFENLQIMNESESTIIDNDEFVKNECEKYGINECSYGTNYKMLSLDPTDNSAEEFINKIEADGYKFIEELKDGIENHESENDVTLVYGKEVEGNRCVIAISIHPSENYTVVSCGYDEEEHDNEFFESAILKNNKDVEEVVDNKQLNEALIDERMLFETTIKINDENIVVTITEDKDDDELYNIYINKGSLYFSDAKDLIGSFEYISFVAAFDYFKNKHFPENKHFPN